MRRLLFGIAVTLSLFVLLAWAATLDWRSPFAARQHLALNGSDFRVVMGGASQDENRLRIGAVGDDRTALQTVVLNGIEASEYRSLRYRFEEFPHTLELSLVFRRSDSAEDVHVVSLPWPGNGHVYFDLRNVAQWKGRITEIGFAEFPTPQVVPPMQGFKPFTLVDAALLSGSWHGDFAALFTDWLGYWPWSQRSVHALGRDTDTPRAKSLVLCVSLAIATIVLWAAIVLRWRGTRLVRLALIGAVVGWLLLDLQWHAGLRWRHAATQTLYADFDWPDRELHSADSDIVQAARELKIALRNEPDTTRILVHAESSFQQLRLVYHLLPMNVAVLAQVVTASREPLPDGCLIVVYETEGWSYDAQKRVLQGGDMVLPGDPVLQRGKLLVMRYRGKP